MQWWRRGAPDVGGDGQPTPLDQLPLPARERLRHYDQAQSRALASMLLEISGQSRALVEEWDFLYDDPFFYLYRCKRARGEVEGEAARRAARDFLTVVPEVRSLGQLRPEVRSFDTLGSDAELELGCACKGLLLSGRLRLP